MSEITMIELEEFNNMVDQIIQDIEGGKTVSNPKAIVDNKIDKEDLILHETATEKGEEIESKRTIIGKPGKYLVVITDNGVETVYGNAQAAADEEKVNPTTVRTRCKKNYIDADGRVWSYQSPE